MRILNPIVRQSRVAPGRRALVDGSRTLTFAELDRLIVRAAAHLRSVGGERGTRVAVMARNSLGWVVTAQACGRLGAVLVPIHPRLSPVEIQRLMSTLTPTVLLTDVTSPAAVASASLSQRLTLADAARAWEGISDADTRDIPDTLELDDPAAIIATSGSSGAPKYVCLTNRNFYFGALASAMHLGHRADDGWLLNLPLCHVGGLSIVHRAAVSGFAIVVQDGFDAEHTMRAIDEHQVTHMSLVATTLQRLIEFAGQNRFPTHVRAVLIGGGRCPAELLHRARAMGLPVLPTYGLTEASSQVATLSPDSSLPDDGSAGRALPLVDIAIRDDAGRVRPNGESGTIWIRGPMVAREYWTAEGVVAAVDADGWFATNDLGCIDATGLLHVLGRADDVIISGGENVSLREIEDALAACDGVGRAAVIGADDAKWGQTPVAFVCADSAQTLDIEQLRSALQDKLARHKVPRRIVVLEWMPETSIGKVDRCALERMIKSNIT